MQIRIFQKINCLLGEGPCWSQEMNALLWVDILRKKLYINSLEGELRQFEIPESLTAFFVCNYVVYGCTENGYCSFDLNSGEFSRLAVIEQDLPLNRSNDGCEDGYGGFVFGTMSWGGDKQTGSIYHVDTSTLEVALLESGYFIPNGFSFVEDSTQLIIADSKIGIMYVYDYDRKKKSLTNKRIFADISESRYAPDGMAVSKNGILVNAEWDGARLSCYKLDGNLQCHIDLPVIRPTSCVFGGKNGESLFITSAREGLEQAILESYPDSGSVLMVEIGKL